MPWRQEERLWNLNNISPIILIVEKKIPNYSNEGQSTKRSEEESCASLNHLNKNIITTISWISFESEISSETMILRLIDQSTFAVSSIGTKVHVRIIFHLHHFLVAIKWNESYSISLSSKNFSLNVPWR